MSDILHPNWSELKSAIPRGIKLFYTACGLGTNPETYEYNVYGSEGTRIYYVHVSGDDATDFVTNYQSTATSVSGIDGVVTLTQPPINTNNIPQVEVITRTGNNTFNQYTITSHNWCKKSTWFQNHDSYTDQAMEPDTGGVYTVYKLTSASGKTPWINIDDFTVTLQDYALNAPPYGQHAAWGRDGALVPREDWRPIIKKNSTIVTSGYEIDYANGKVTFGSALTSGDNVTISFRTPKTSGGSEFILMPRAGKKLSIPHTEINMTDDVAITGTVVFEVWAGDPTFTMIPQYEPYYLQYRMEYKSMHQIFGLSVVGGDYYPAMGGTDLVTASAETGWSTDQKRGMSTGLREIPYDFGVAAGWGKSIVLRADQFAYIKAYIKNDSILGGEYCSLSLYVEEDDL